MNGSKKRWELGISHALVVHATWHMYRFSLATWDPDSLMQEPSERSLFLAAGYAVHDKDVSICDMLKTYTKTTYSQGLAYVKII